MVGGVSFIPRDIGTGTGPILPSLALTGSLTFQAGAGAGTLVANIANVPSGVTPTLTPGDGRLVIGGSEGAGWKVVVGLTASSAGTIALTVSAAGANSVSVSVTVSAASAFTPVVARPTPTGTVRTANTSMSAATINALNDASNDGDCLEFMPGTYDKDTVLPNGFNRTGVIYRAASIGAYDADPMGDGGTPHWARFQRLVIFSSGAALGGVSSKITADNVTVQDFFFTRNASLWPADNADWSSICAAASSTWAYLQIASGVSGAKILYCEFADGYGTSKTPYDPGATTRLLDMRSSDPWYIRDDGGISNTTANSTGGNLTPRPGWGDGTDFVRYNRILTGPYAISAEGGRAGTGLTIYGNYIHDIGHGLNGVLPRGGAYIQQHNWMTRVYHDYGTISTANLTPPSSIRISQNVWLDGFSDVKDNANPHQDDDQIFVSNGGTRLVFNNLEGDLNLSGFTTATVRGAPQLHYWQGGGGGFVVNDSLFVAPKVRENIGMMAGTIYATFVSVHEDAYIEGNDFFHPDTLSNGSVPAAALITMNSKQGIGASRSNKSGVFNNLMEGAVAASATPAITEQAGNVNIGRRDARAIPLTTAMTGGAQPQTVKQIFDYRQKKAGYTGAGVKRATVADMLLGPLNWAGKRPFAGFVDSIDQTPATLITSNPAWIHGGNTGDALTFTPPAGIEWRTLALDRTTQAKPWTSAAGSVSVDLEYLQVRATSPAQGQSTAFTMTLGGQSVTWNVASLSTAVYPAVAADGNGRFQRTGTAALTGSDSSFMTFALEWECPGVIPAANRTVFGDTNNLGPVTCFLLGGSSGLLRFVVRNAAGTALGTINCTVPMSNATKRRILLSVDVSQTNSADGVRLLVDGANGLGSITGWAGGPGVTIGWSRTGLTYSLMGAGANYVPAHKIGFFYLNTVVRANLDDGSVVAKFNSDKIGTNGQNVTGAAPLTFLVGNASQWNAGTQQFGTGMAWNPVGSTVTDVTGGQPTWP